MGLIKSYEEFLNENLLGQYSYYGAGSLFPIVAKLASEGKTINQLYTYLTSLGIDEERKRKVLSQVFLTESIDFDTLAEGLLEDDTEDLVKADVKDLEKGLDPSKAKPDADVKKALDKLKSGDDESDEDKSKEGETKDTEEEKSDKIEALQAALADAEKLEKIKKILGESLELDFEGVEDSIVADLFDYHKVVEGMDPKEREKLKDSDFVFPDKRSWPIHDEKHAKTALVWATWPQYKDLKKQIVAVVTKKYPQLKGVGAAK
jgi:hypothetical protein